MKSRKLEILVIYTVLISAVTIFWAVFFKIFCPHFMVYGVIFVALITSIISSVLITNCFIKMKNESEKSA